MSYDMCGHRWGEVCSWATLHSIEGSHAHFCSRMVASDGDDCGGPHECNCGEKLGDAPKRRAMSPAVQALVIGAAIIGGGANGPMRSTRAEREARKAARFGGDKRLAAAKSKRERKAARRRAAKSVVSETEPR